MYPPALGARPGPVGFRIHALGGAVLETARLPIAVADIRNHRISESLGAGLAPDIAGENLAFFVYTMDGGCQASSGFAFADVGQHQDSRLHECRRISHAFAGDVRRGTVHGL